MRIGFILAGAVALSVGCSHMHGGKDAEGEEKNEVKMSINDVPPAVRDSLNREAGGQMIKSVDREEQNGKTIYETDVMMNGKNWEIKVDENGKTISKKIDNEEAEKSMKKHGKHDEEEEENEHK